MGDLLAYNYYAELADTVMKMEATGSATYSMAQTLTRSESGYSFDTLGAACEFLLLEAAGAAFSIMQAGLASSAPAAAAFGDCDPFVGYGSEVISLPFKGLYDKN